MFIYKALNIFFFLFHSLLVLFNVFGWAFPRLRKWNLVTLLLTGCSWFVLGIWYGWGYCPCTDWHWAVREHLGYSNGSRSYIHFLLYEVCGVDLSPSLVEAGTGAVFFACLGISIWLNIRDLRRGRGAKRSIGTSDR